MSVRATIYTSFKEFRPLSILHRCCSKVLNRVYDQINSSSITNNLHFIIFGAHLNYSLNTLNWNLCVTKKLYIKRLNTPFITIFHYHFQNFPYLHNFILVHILLWNNRKLTRFKFILEPTTLYPPYWEYQSVGIYKELNISMFTKSFWELIVVNEVIARMINMTAKSGISGKCYSKQLFIKKTRLFTSICVKKEID